MDIVEFIQAQGANHLPKSRLTNVIHQIVNEQNDTFPPHIDNNTRRRCEVRRMIHDKYGIEIDEDWVNPYSYCVEEKYDGYSYINAGGRFYSKRLSTAKGNAGSPIDKTDNIPHISRILKNAYESCGCDLHGELYMTGGTSDDVTKIMGCTPEKAQKRQIDAIRKIGADGALHYMLIDIRAFNGKKVINEPHRVRRAILKYVYEKYIKPYNYARYVQLTEEFNDRDPRDTFRSIVTGGGEGIIIKKESALYIPGKKPMDNWIKGKKSITHDVFMIGLNEGTGKNEKLFGSIRFAHIVDNKIVECGNCSSGLSDEMRQFIYNNADELIANRQVFEIEAIQQSVKSFRNPQFIRLRDDKVWTECTPALIRVKEELI